VQYINDLTVRGLSPMSQIVKNLAEEILGLKLEYYWVGRLIERKKKLLKSLYLIIIDHKRKIADNSHFYNHFFENVRLIFSL